MPENSTHKCTNAVNNVHPVRNSSHMAKILSVYNRLQAGDYENGNGGKRRVSRHRLTQFIHATLRLLLLLLPRVAVYWTDEFVILLMCRWLQTTITYNATLVVCRGVSCTVFRHLCLHPEAAVPGRFTRLAAYNKKQYIYCRPINGHGAYASTHYWGTQ